MRYQEKLVLTDGESQRKSIREIFRDLIYMEYMIYSEEDIQRIKDSLDSVSSKTKKFQ